MTTVDRNDLRFIRAMLLLTMAGLLLFGITAVPLVSGTAWLVSVTSDLGSPIAQWAQRVHEAVTDVDDHYPFLFYGTDWLAFAHVVIALAFVGPYRDPCRNRWVIVWGIWMCVLVLPMAFLWAPVRGIPFFWRCVDGAFGVVGMVPLWLALRRVDRFRTSSQ
ncbi:MAG: hypothetical protein H6594_05855 [Flavobacteriales bacterium]|nr:hypothetical protein [Flavobacteriales bacterium]